MGKRIVLIPAYKPEDKMLRLLESLRGYQDAENENDSHLIDRPIQDKKILSAIDNKIKPFTQGISDEIKNTLVDAVTNAVSTNKAIDNPNLVKEVIFKKLENPKDTEKEKLVKVNDSENQTEPEYEISEVKPDNNEIEKAEDTAIKSALNDKKIAKEVDDAVQNKISPLKNLKSNSISTARDLKLREEQKKVRVNNSTIEEILARDANNVKIETDDYSDTLKTINPNVKKITFTGA